MYVVEGCINPLRPPQRAEGSVIVEESAGPSESVATAPMPVVERRCEFDGCAPLKPRQKRFARDICRTRHWEIENPRVSRTHTARVQAGSLKAAILAYLADGSFRTVMEIAEATGGLPASVSARIREARSEGANILRDELVGHAAHAHRYRLVPKAEGSR